MRKVDLRRHMYIHELENWNACCFQQWHHPYCTETVNVPRPISHETFKGFLYWSIWKNIFWYSQQKRDEHDIFEAVKKNILFQMRKSFLSWSLNQNLRYSAMSVVRWRELAIFVDKNTLIFLYRSVRLTSQKQYTLENNGIRKVCHQRNTKETDTQAFCHVGFVPDRSR